MYGENICENWDPEAVCIELDRCVDREEAK